MQEENLENENDDVVIDHNEEQLTQEQLLMELRRRYDEWVVDKEQLPDTVTHLGKN